MFWCNKENKYLHETKKDFYIFTLIEEITVDNNILMRVIASVRPLQDQTIGVHIFPFIKIDTNDF